MMNTENKEITNGESKLEPNNKDNSVDSGKITENFQNIIRQQQEQIDQLIKQQELSKKINQNLTEVLNQKLAKEEENKDKFGWVDEVIAKNFHHNYDLDETNPINTDNTDKIAVWYMNYLKDKKNQTNEQIHSRMDRMFRMLSTGKQTEHESKI